MTNTRGRGCVSKPDKHVIEHERGYRAEFAKIVALNRSRRFTLSPLSRLKAWRQMRAARERYGVTKQNQP